jgi:hypothetical protein
MTVNHGGRLSKEYFLSYIKLVSNSRNCSIATAKEITLELFFKQDINRFGKDTYKSFLDAFQELTVKEHSGFLKMADF